MKVSLTHFHHLIHQLIAINADLLRGQGSFIGWHIISKFVIGAWDPILEVIVTLWYVPVVLPTSHSTRWNVEILRSLSLADLQKNPYSSLVDWFGSVSPSNQSRGNPLLPFFCHWLMGIRNLIGNQSLVYILTFPRNALLVYWSIGPCQVQSPWGAHSLSIPSRW